MREWRSGGLENCGNCVVRNGGGGSGGGRSRGVSIVGEWEAAARVSAEFNFLTP